MIKNRLIFGLAVIALCAVTPASGGFKSAMKAVSGQVVGEEK